MKREIRFRGRSKDTGAWVYGSLIDKDYIIHYIDHAESFTAGTSDHKVTCRATEVDSETIGQYTGLDAIGKVQIFEGDIVKWGHIKGGEENPIRVAEVKINPDILFDSKNCDHVFRYGNFIYTNTKKYLSVIGNIYEHPKLLSQQATK